MRTSSPSDSLLAALVLPAPTALALAVCLAAPLPAPAAEPSPTHPLDPLGAGEMHRAVAILRDEGRLTEDALFPLVTLEEPPKSVVLGWSEGDPVPRRAFLVVKQGPSTYEAVVDLTAGRSAAWKRVEGVQPGILMAEEWGLAGSIVRSHPGWRAALERRGIADPEGVVNVPLTVGHFGGADESGERLVKVVSFDGREADNYWGRPIEGLVAVVSLDRGQVVELLDSGGAPVPDGPVDLDLEALGPPGPPAGKVRLARTGDAGYRLEGHRVRWRAWSFRWRIDPRLGPVISRVTWDDGVRRRSILYQGSLSEMFVPYTDPDEAWYFRAYLDAGEFGLGKLSSALEPRVDCPAHATLLHALFADDWGNAYAARGIACLFERATGDLAWRHHESVTGVTESRRLTELVLRSIPAVGNYDYVVDWIFRPDGTLRVEVGATGVPQVKAVPSRAAPATGPDPDAAWGRRVAPHTVAVNHDHYLCFRLDLDVDGPANTLLRERLRPVALDGDGPRPGSWRVEPQAIEREGEARLRIDLERPALWRVVNEGVRGPLGYPVGYQVVPGVNAVPLFAADDPLLRRAGFTRFHLWATRHAPGELYAAGAYPNQSAGGDGLPAWSDRDRSIRDADLVLWYTLGMHHVVRAEEWPVLPTTRSGFELRPFDFFPRNPALDLPPDR